MMGFLLRAEKTSVRHTWESTWVIFLLLKGVDGLTFETAKSNLISLVRREADSFDFLQNSEKLSTNEKECMVLMG